MHAGQSDVQSHRGTFCVCLWVGGEGVFWVCVSGGLSTIIYNYSVVLSLLWFSRAGWVAESLGSVFPHSILQVALMSTTDIQHPHRISTRQHNHFLSSRVGSCSERSSFNQRTGSISLFRRYLSCWNNWEALEKTLNPCQHEEAILLVTLNLWPWSDKQ